MKIIKNIIFALVYMIPVISIWVWYALVKHYSIIGVSVLFWVGTLILSMFVGFYSYNWAEKFNKWFKSNLKENENPE